ncbi:MAG: tRNA dihydrouridine synthase DusB [Planctomycetota bacterium]|nr:tRNA dihydrouridine synthase DusB [Planctomycetota bacterium]
MDSIYKSAVNADVSPAGAGEFAPLHIGPIEVWPPVVLAPMAGVTNYPFRKICRRYGAGLYVSEMITARALLENNEKTLKIADFGPDETPRSMQLYGVEPRSLGEATRRLVGEGKVDHIDMNFGCPVRKVTSKGGGSAIPAKPRLLRNLVRAVVANAEDVPVTLKFRIGIDDALVTYRDAGRIGEEEGCVAVGLHARTAAQLYDGEARWEAIADLKARVAIPVLGNGDIWEAHDALRMMRQTGCDGVIVGRGCLGRPWLFRDLADVFDGREPENPPDFGTVLDLMLEHAALVCDWFGEHRGMMMMRKFTTWYTKSFPGGSTLRQSMTRVRTLDELREIVRHADRTLPFPPAGMRVKRGKRSGTQKVALPHGYLDHLDDATPPVAGAEDPVSGG